MEKKIKRIFVGICIVTGDCFTGSPFLLPFHGQNETDKLIELFENTLDNEDETEESKEEGKEQTSLVKKMQPYFQGKMSLALLRLKP